MDWKGLACGVLAAAMLAVPALAAEGADMPTQKETAEFQLPQQGRLGPVELYGTVTSVTEESLMLNRGEEEGDVVLHISEQTALVDGTTGAPLALSDLKEGDGLYAWTSPAMAMSLPPQTTAYVLVCNVPQDAGAPFYVEIQRVDAREQGGISALGNDDVVLHLTEETEMTAYRTKNVVGLDDIRPGTKALVWYEVVMESFPAQAVPTKVVVFPYDYTGWMALGGVDDVELNGEKLDLPAPAYVEGEELMLPVRTVAEALGCEVQWSAEAPEQVAVTKDGHTLYTLTIGGDTAVVEGDEVTQLFQTVTAREGVTSMAASDLGSLHTLKVEGQWPL